jgi:RHS repeat-associated protein
MRLYPTDIIDQQGNTSTIDYIPYDDTEIARVSRITDPIGRQVNFHYNNVKQLTAITAPAIGGGERVIARLTYQILPAYIKIHPSEQSKDIIAPTPFLQGIYFPATKTGYWFGDNDSYSRYGMIIKVVEQTGMNHGSPTLTETGILTPGTAVYTRTYDFPFAAPEYWRRTAFPKYRSLTESFAGMKGSPLGTQFDDSSIYNTDELWVEKTLPDGSSQRTTLNDGGLPSSRIYYVRPRKIVGRETFEWIKGNDQIFRIAAVTEIDSESRKKRTEFTYNSSNLLSTSKMWDWIGENEPFNEKNLLKQEHYYYIDDPEPQTVRGIRGLMRSVQISGSRNLDERTDYEYDTLPLQSTPGIERNVFATPNFRPDLKSKFPVNAEKYRGLLTRTRLWVDPNAELDNNTIDVETTFTAAGLPAEQKTAGRTDFSVVYLPQSSYSLPHSLIKGAFVSPGATTRAISQLKWDVATGKLLSFHQPSEGVLHFNYDDALRLVGIQSSRGPGVQRNFLQNALGYVDTIRANNGEVQRVVTTNIDGKDRRTYINDHPADLTPLEYWFEYDSLGRLILEKNGATYSSATYYDNVGRVSHVLNSDGSSKWFNYDRAHAPASVLSRGTLRKETDAWERSRYIVNDALGRTVEVLEEKEINSNKWIKTGYLYDATSNLTAIFSEVGDTLFPTRLFRYDGLSRLTHRILMERSATLDSEGKRVESGTFSDVYTYDSWSRLLRHYDPRGVVTNYDYRSDPLGRLFSVKVTLPPLSAGQPPILPVPETRFSYMRSGDPMRLANLRSVGVYEKNYRYNHKSQLDEIITTFSDHSSTPLRQSIAYDSAGNVSSTAAGVSASENLPIYYSYDKSGQPITVGNENAASGSWKISANFKGPYNTLSELLYKYDQWTATETFTVSPERGKVTEQLLSIANTPVLHKDYFYNSWPLYTPPSSGPVIVPPSLLTSANQLVAIRDRLKGLYNFYDYDSFSRLIRSREGRELKADATGYEYTYDGAGNRIASRGMVYTPVATPGASWATPPIFRSDDASEWFADGQIQLAINPKTNRIINQGFEYDLAGNIVRLPRKDGKVLLLDYDGLGRLGRIKFDGSSEVESYRYEPNNQISVLTRTDGSLRYSIWLDEINGSHFETLSPQAELTHSETSITLGGEVIGRMLGPVGTTHLEFLHQTPNGLYFTTPLNNGIRSAELHPYGYGLTFGTIKSFTPAFHSYARSSFGLDYAINRHYDPETGRFVQPDPIGENVFELADPQTLNLYTFTRDDPVNRRDPFGLCPTAAPGEYATFVCADRLGPPLIFFPHSAGRPPGQREPTDPPERPQSSHKPSTPAKENPKPHKEKEKKKSLAECGEEVSMAAFSWWNSRKALALARAMDLIKTLKGSPMTRPIKQLDPIVRTASSIGREPPVLPLELQEVMNKFILPSPLILFVNPDLINSESSQQKDLGGCI